MDDADELIDRFAVFYACAKETAAVHKDACIEEHLGLLLSAGSAPVTDAAETTAGNGTHSDNASLSEIAEKIRQKLRALAAQSAALNLAAFVPSNAANSQPTHASIVQATESIKLAMTSVNNLKYCDDDKNGEFAAALASIEKFHNLKMNLESGLAVLTDYYALSCGLEVLSNFIALKSFADISKQYPRLKAKMAQAIEKYAEFSFVKKMTDRLEKLSAELKRCVFEEMEVSTLSDAHIAIVQELGVSVLDEFVEKIITERLRDYDSIFRNSATNRNLNGVVRRIEWFKEVFVLFTRESAWPVHWKCDLRLYLKFVFVLKNDLKEILDGLSAQTKDQKSPANVLDVVKFCVKFESDFTAALKYPTDDLKGILVEVFDPFLGVFAESQEKELRDLFKKISFTETKDGIFECAISLFIFFKASLFNCSSISNQNTMLSTLQLFKKYLKKFTNALVHSKATAAGNCSVLRIACFKINTLDYCISTVQQLEEKSKILIRANLVSSVDFSDSVDFLQDKVSFLIFFLQKECLSAIEGDFEAMKLIDWNKIDSIRDASPYATHIGCILKEFMLENKRSLIQLANFRTIFDRACEFVSEMFLNALFALKLTNRNSLAAEQLLLDCSTIKACFLAFEKKIKTTNFETIEKLCKCLIAPADSLVIMFHSLFGAKIAAKNSSVVSVSRGMELCGKLLAMRDIKESDSYLQILAKLYSSNESVL